MGFKIKKGVLVEYNEEYVNEVDIPDSVTKIGKLAFYGCSRLKSITIPDSVTSIGDGAFKECVSLTSITLPDSVTKIGDSAFFFCSLERVTFPDSVTDMEPLPFTKANIHKIFGELLKKDIKNYSVMLEMRATHLNIIHENGWEVDPIKNLRL